MADSNGATTSTLAAALLTLSALTLGLALHLNDGLFLIGAVRLLAVAFVLTLAAVALPRIALPQSVLRWLLLCVAIAQMIAMLCRRAGASELTVPQVDQQPYQVGVALALVMTLAIAFSGKWRWWGFAGVLLSFAWIGCWKIRAAPSPKIDVFVFQTDAGDALRNLKNPYAITFPNIYGPDATVYGPGMVRDGRLLFGYPYPPVVLMITAPVQWLLNDFRYAQLLSMLIAATCLALMRRDEIGPLAAMVLLFTPRAAYVLEMGWTEPISAMLLMLAILPRRGSVAGLGLFAVSKQYLPAMLLLASRRTALPAALLGLVVTAPLALWDIKAFVHSVVTLQLHQPYRADSLSFLAWYGSSRPGWAGPFWLAFVTLAIGLGLAIWRRAGFALSVAAGLFCFIAFNKQAFANYYYLVIAATCAAIARENCSRFNHASDTQIIGPCADSSSSSSSP